MALRNQPYIPLYVQDFMTDEKLIECSASATGVYIRLMCIMHKSEEYGKILLKQKDKQKISMTENFALKVSKQMPYSIEEIASSIQELINENVIHIEGDYLVQRRMVKDNDISNKRSKAGKKGGDNNPFAQAKTQANSENENEDIKEDSIIPNFENLNPFQKFSFSDTKTILTEKSQIWHEQIMMSDPRIKTQNQLKEVITKFLLKQNSTGSYFPVSIDDVRRHFAYTLPKIEIESPESTGVKRLNEVF